VAKPQKHGKALMNGGQLRSSDKLGFITKSNNPMQNRRPQDLVVGARASLVSNSHLDPGICDVCLNNFGLLILAILARDLQLQTSGKQATKLSIPIIYLRILGPQFLLTTLTFNQYNELNSKWFSSI